jgi:dTDP-glucose pyrophosphorylase
MIQRVVQNIGIRGNFIFIVQSEHYDKYFLDIVLNAIAPNCKIVKTDGVTQGAACSVLLAKHHINSNAPLVIANSDQLVEWNSEEFFGNCTNSDIDGSISTFKCDHPKFSYAKIDDSLYVTEVAEKKVISNHATTGIYYWKRGSDFVKYAEEMIRQNIRVNNEFYVAPVFNMAIKDNKRFTIQQCEQFHCLGTPEDLEEFLLKNINKI